MKILKTKNYYFGVELTTDNSLIITAEYQHIGNGKWISCHSMPWPDAAALIGSFGGVDKVLARCEEIDDLAALVEGRNAANIASRELGLLPTLKRHKTSISASVKTMKRPLSVKK